MKQGRTEKVVFAKLSKVELSAIDDLKAALRSGTQTREQGYDMVGKAYAKYDKALREFKEAVKMGEDLLKKAKELGANDLVKEINKGLNFAKEDIAKTQKAMNAFDKL
tara:strand:- start:45 stop:368 length:324 start_codon:yes stop_codon:yes gene_type:complete